ncbi:uncharacterized protein LOC143418764 isoform X2 [Maylandia zebra]|uniref:uncharacterized protein LOC143418764 isoform X2 n=1 Tax=Maylandia zebra TaxID=106582 RepID=UPI00403CDB7F
MAVSGTIFQGSTCTPTSRVHVDKKGASKSLKQEMFKQDDAKDGRQRGAVLMLGGLCGQKCKLSEFSTLDFLTLGGNVTEGRARSQQRSRGRWSLSQLP